MEHAVEAAGLTKHYGDGRGILDLDLRVPRGRVFGFLGPNGAGKTTTLRLLMGFLRPDRGTATVLGEGLAADRARLHRRIGYVPGELALPGGERVGAYLRRAARLQGCTRERQEDLMACLRLDPGRRIRELSKGNRQKVALVQALQHDPELLVLDEPTDGLDPVLRQEVSRILREHARGGGTTFLSSHVVHEVETVCDEVAVVVAGRLRSHAAVQDLLAALPLRVRLRVPAGAQPAARAVLEAYADRVRALESGATWRLELRGDPLPVLAGLHEAGARDAAFEAKDLEETFLDLYRGAP